MAHPGAWGGAAGAAAGSKVKAGEEAAATGPACWFCSKGRHAECMRELPVAGRSDGPHDCSFDTDTVACGCPECGRAEAGAGLG